MVLTMVPTAGDPLGRLSDATVLVPGGVTVGLGPDLPVPPDTRVVAGGHCVVLPGLVNAHNHVAMTLLRGYGRDLPLDRWLSERIWPAEERLTSQDVCAGALLGCLEMLRGGITAFADMYMWMDAVGEAAVTSGIRASLSRGIVGLDPGWEAKIAEAADFCRRWEGQGDGRITTMVAPHAEYTCPRPLWKEAVALAADLGVRIHTHVSETAAEVAGCRQRHGCSPVAFLGEVGALDRGLLAAHCVHIDAQDARLLARPEVGVVTNPVSNAKLGSGIAPLEMMRQAGVAVCLGSDGAASTDTLGLWEEMRLAAWLQKAVLQDPAAMPAEDVLRMATTDGNRALGLPGGQLAPGAPADLIMVDLSGLHQSPHPDLPNNLVYGGRDADVRLTVVGGRIVMEDGAFPGIDHEALAADVVRRAQRILSS